MPLQATRVCVLKELVRTIAQLQKLQKQASTVNCEMSELRNVEDPAPIDVRTLEDEVANLDRKISELESRKDELSQKLESAKHRLETLEADMQTVEDRIRIAAQKLDPYRERLARVDGEVERARQDLKHYEQKQAEFEANLAEIRQRQSAAETEVAETSAKASQICAEKVRTRRTAQNLESEITQTQRQIAVEQRSRGADQDEVAQTYADKKARLDAVSAEVHQLACFLDKLASMLADRQRWYLCMRDSLTMILRCNFYRHVCVRPCFSGQLTISHSRQTIRPVLHTDPADAPATSSSSRTLSGGERSYATACFILSLWELMDAPFRCLDEFDVYMDLVNRRMCMDMMLRAAEKKRDCQFVFLSPLSMSQLQITDNPNIDLKIFEMAPPRDNHRPAAAAGKDAAKDGS